MRKVGSQGNISNPASSSKTEASSSSAAAAAAAAAAATPSSSSSSSSLAAGAAAPAPAPLTQEQIAKQKASKQLSKQMAVMDLKSRLNKDASKGNKEDLKTDLSRKAGNLGVYADVAATRTGHAAAAAGGLLSASAGALTDMVLHGGNTMKAIKHSYGKEVLEDFKAAQKSTQSELAALKKKGKSELGLDINDKEKLERLELLSKSFESEPMAIARAIQENRSDPAYKIMGPSHFVSMEVSTRKKLEAAGKGNYGLSTMERVAMYGYTTKDFTVINPALREAKGGAIANPEIRAYVSHINNGLSKLPDYQPPADNPGLYRGMVGSNLPQFIKDQMRVGGELKDFAFASTSTDKVAAQSAGDYQLEITNFAGKGAKLLPFSAFEGEGEVLFPPGTTFKLTGLAPFSQKRFFVDVQ